MFRYDDDIDEENTNKRMDKAADEIERLQKENDRLDEELFRKQMAIVRIQAENEEEMTRQQKQMAAMRSRP
jgi:hypothetical protein